MNSDSGLDERQVKPARLQCLFEHCYLNTIKHTPDFAKDEAGNYINQEMQDHYELWLSGHCQGVVDHAVYTGEVKL